jgi:hypothetical protein
MKKQIFFILVLFFFVGCQNNGNGKLENEIETSIKESCKSDNCEVDISKITSFKWSKFYVFKETASLEIIEMVLNHKYSYYTDAARRLIFTDSNGKIIYHEDIFPNVEGVKNKEVIFLMSDTTTYRVFTNRAFTITKEKINGGEYYILDQ